MFNLSSTTLPIINHDKVSNTGNKAVLYLSKHPLILAHKSIQVSFPQIKKVFFGIDQIVISKDWKNKGLLYEYIDVNTI